MANLFIYFCLNVARLLAESDSHENWTQLQTGETKFYRQRDTGLREEWREEVRVRQRPTTRGRWSGGECPTKDRPEDGGTLVY